MYIKRWLKNNINNSTGKNNTNKNILKSIVALFAGFVTVVLLSVGTDFVLESLGIFPPQNEPLSYTWLMLLFALIYRCIYTIAGGYVTARLAPDRPMRHAVILGYIGIAAALAGVAVAWNFSPQHWYPIALVITALPCTWLGGKLKKINNVQPTTYDQIIKEIAAKQPKG